MDGLPPPATEHLVGSHTHPAFARTLFACALVSVVALRGCTLARGPVPVRERAEIVDTTLCPLPVQAGLLGLTPPDELVPQGGSRAGVVPDDFAPVAAVTCGEYLAQTVSAELTTTFDEKHWAGDFTRAIERLNAPSEGPRLNQDRCPIASLVALPDLWLVDDRGRAVRPSYPVDECGFQQIGGLREVEALDPTDTITHTLRLRPEQLLQWMNCGIQPVVPFAGDRALVRDGYYLGGSVCRYTTDPAGSVKFLGAEQLPENLDDNFAGLLTAPVCTTSATTVVNTSLSFYGPEPSDPQPVYIELDGCRRILIADHQPLSATAAIVDHFG